MQNFPAQIFKSYDIRGKDEEITPEIAEGVGRAYVELTKAKNIVIGRDMRLSSPEIFENLVKGITSAGANVVNIGRCTTPMLNFALAMNKDIDGGIMITASHNPPGWNGIKMVRSNMIPIGKGNGMEEIRDLVKTNEFKDAEKRGTITQKDTQEDYLNKIFEYTGEVDLKNLKVVADAGNGMAGDVIREAMKRANADLTELFFEQNGTFPNHEANPAKQETLKSLQETVVKEGAAIGLAYDADGDRIGLVDETGKIIPGDIIGAIIAEEILLKTPGSTILGNVQCGRDLEDLVNEKGGTYVKTQVGHAGIKKTMNEQRNAKLGIELSAHLYYKDFWNVESAVLSSLLILKLITEKGIKTSELSAKIQKRSADSLNIETEQKTEIMDALYKEFKKDADTVIEIDGFRFEFRTWWLTVRASNTEPVLRFSIEADTKKELTTRISNLKKTIEKIKN